MPCCNACCSLVDEVPQVIPRNVFQHALPHVAIHMDYFTLERGEYNGVSLGDPRQSYPLLYGGSDIYLPQLKHPHQGNVAARQMIMGLGEQVNLKAPGVRDLKANPSFPTYGTRYRTELVDTNQTRNNAPIANWEQNKELFRAPWVQRAGAEWYRVLQESDFNQRPQWQERGQFIVAGTGFSALQNLKPVSTVPFL